MSKIKGQNFRLLQNAAAIPEATNCSITLQGNTEDNSTKDTEGMFNQETIVSTQWSAQVDTQQSDTAALRAIISQHLHCSPGRACWLGSDGRSAEPSGTECQLQAQRSGTSQ